MGRIPVVPEDVHPQNAPKPAEAEGTSDPAPASDLDRASRESRIYSPPFRIAGSRGSSVSLPDAREDPDSIRPVANVLLAAAHADGKFCESEQATVRGLLCQLLGVDELPESLAQHL